MKRKFIFLFTLSLFCASAYAQEFDTKELEKTSNAVVSALTDTTNTEHGKWTTKGITGLNMSQSSFTNWSAGGENAFALNAYLNGGVYFRKKRSAWDNDLSLGYGLTNTKENGWRKNADNIDFSSKYGYALNKHWFYSALLGFKTQFTRGYNYPNDSIYISNFMAPGYLTASIGMDYRPIDQVSIFMSPATGRFTFVLDDELSDQGAFGVDPGEKFRAQIGAYVRATYSGDIMRNVNLITKLELFTAYDDTFGNIDVSWDVMLAMKINKYLTATLSTNLVYDDDVKYIDEDSIEHGPRVQFKEVLGIGLAYTF